MAGIETAGFELGDEVRVADTPKTAALDLAGATGVVYGVTTPSVTGIEFVSEDGGDLAVGVSLSESDEIIWFEPALLELIGRSPGMTASIAGKSFVRSADGSWSPDQTPWWRRLRKERA